MDSDLKIYHQYIELINYTNMILKKYPKVERYGIIIQINKHTYDGLSDIIKAIRIYDKVGI